ncbi:hypothetical protein LEP1GSC043_3832 [Leptospira weilii str. Ecochallenge]|uniref:Uncharacterized protein n=1 Tax=Leptospira weilii str. Ecochallenge TaxID=1049986 RepID=N1UB79_9LEPT|nr:hypothetical protein LEP1GSC043_3832 [Leptospira weilii str. Ecochallenge]
MEFFNNSIEDDSDYCEIKFILNDRKFHYKNENFFFALIDARKDLENLNIQICCYGAAKNIYPSSMALSMGYGIKAYMLNFGKQAKKSDAVANVLISMKY